MIGGADKTAPERAVDVHVLVLIVDTGAGASPVISECKNTIHIPCWQELDKI